MSAANPDAPKRSGRLVSLLLDLSTREAEVRHVEVVESSRRLGDIEASGGSKDEPA